MIWFLLSGYFIIAAVFYNTAPVVIRNTVEDLEHQYEKDFAKKYGKIIIFGLSVAWPITVSYAIVVLLSVLIKNK